MGRLGNFFRKIGRGVKKAAVWTSKNIIRPLVKQINGNPDGIIGKAVDSLGPVGANIKSAAKMAERAYNVYDNRDKFKGFQSPSPNTGPNG
jgi:hypothetical protein